MRALRLKTRTTNLPLLNTSKTMLNPKVEAALNAQINAELWSAYLYLSMAA